jgi:cystathionine beta-synthase
MKEKRLLGAERMTLGLLHELKVRSGKPALIAVTPDTLINEMLDLMSEYGITQLPVLEGGQSVGSIREHRVMAQVLEDRSLLNQPVSRVLEPSFPVVNEAVEVARAKSYLKESPAMLVEEYGRIIGLVTRFDVLDLGS